MTNEIKGGDAGFKYEQLDGSTAEFLRKKETNMREIVGKAYTDLGRELSEAQDLLAKHGYGCFEEWFTALGFKKRNVYRIIDRYNLVRANLAQSDIIEELPVSLAYEVSGKSSESTPEKAQAKAEVLAGEIATNKAYEERIAELEREKTQAEQAKTQAETSAQAERKERERLEEENEELSDRLADIPEAKEPEVRYEKVTEYVEVKDESIEQRLLEYEERFGAIENYSGRVQATNISEVTTSVMTFSKAVRDLAKRHAYLIKYQQTLSALDGTTKQEYNEAVRALTDLARDFNEVSEDGAVIIDI